MIPPTAFTPCTSPAPMRLLSRQAKGDRGLDELFSPFYSEDMELSIRAWRLNWKCYYEHQAVCRHRLSATTKNYKTANWVKRRLFSQPLLIPCPAHEWAAPVPLVLPGNADRPTAEIVGGPVLDMEKLPGIVQKRGGH